ETAMTEYRAALDRDPGNIEYRLKYQQARFAAAFDHCQKGRRALLRDDVQAARAEFARAYEIDPTNDLAKQELDKVDELIRTRTQNLPEPRRDLESLKYDSRTD